MDTGNVSLGMNEPLENQVSDWDMMIKVAPTTPTYLLSGRDATAGDVLKSCRETCDG